MTQTTAPTTEAYRVLVIDDDLDVSEYTRTVLERKSGCSVRVLNASASAREAVAEFRPDVVVTDIEMPGVTGLELIALLREDTPQLPIIVMTAHVSIDYAVKALRSQADEFFTKPISSAQLGAAVVRLAAGWRATRESESELEHAAEVQRGLMPVSHPELPGYELAGGCAPVRTVGGDFFDWSSVPGGIDLTIADVMGKGIGAAIIAAAVRSVLRSSARSSDLGVAMTVAADELQPDLRQSGAFVTVFRARLDAASGLVRFADAGHGLSIISRRNGTTERLSADGLPLGIGLGGSWIEKSVDLDPGDTLITVSDGVLDLYDGTLNSLDEVSALASDTTSAQEIVDTLLGMASRGAVDDVTVVVLRRTT
jgi:sigma-B regulation protein RsbU (phosphoserine phosphatase)